MQLISMAASSSITVYAQCTLLWGSLLLCDYALTKQVQGLSTISQDDEHSDASEKTQTEKDEDVANEDEDGLRDQISYGQRLYMSLFGKGTKELTYGGTKYAMYTLSNVGFGVLIWMFGELLGGSNTDRSLNRNLVNIQAPFHLLVALSSVYFDGFEAALNPVKRHPEIPIYNILSISITILWFLMIIVESLAPVSKDLETTTTAAEVSALYILDFLVQPFWTGAYIMTSFLPIGLLNAYLSIKFLISCPADYAAILKELSTFPPSLATNIAMAVAGGLGLVAIPMAALFIQPRLFECLAQVRTVTDDAQEEMKKNPEMIEELLQSILEHVPDEIKGNGLSLKALSEKIQIPQEVKDFNWSWPSQTRKKQTKTE